MSTPTDVSSLLVDPLWRAEDLGRPLPNSVHAASVCLPTWRDTIGYEENDPRMRNALQAGYPRFVIHPLCQKLFARCVERFGPADAQCYAFPTARSAQRFSDFLRTKTGQPSLTTHDAGGYFACLFTAEQASAAKSYWQHTGEGISSRLAEQALNAWPNAIECNDGHTAKQTIRRRLADAYGCDPIDIFLFPAGMTAIYTAHRALTQLHGQVTGVQFGFPYVDTLKVLQKFGAAQFCPNASRAELQQLEQSLKAGGIAGVFTEHPTNPLLLCPNLAELSRITREHGAALIVDDTLATPVNTDVLPACDIVCSSLTKFFSGIGDVTAGALVLNRNGPMYAELRRAMDAVYDDLFFAGDAEVLERNSRTWVERVRRINVNAERVADAMKQRPKVAAVHYPKFQSPSTCDSYRRPDGGYGGLMSLVLHNAADVTARFFDALRLNKGPNLGTEFTLACPFTILAHYDELDFAESCGVSRYLIRLSIGLEPAEELIRRLDDALAAI
ncbi:MAG: PLP-dependent transferase [Tepidisphaeraceae bacterium]